MATEEQRIKAERIKALLSGYYGTGASQGQPAAPGLASDAQGGPDNARQQAYGAAMATLDSPTFNAERHIAHMLRTSTLEKLMMEHRSMSREIKHLDSDMQQLVYENYSKFISATDTIRAMKSNVDGMGSEMDKLKSIMDNVADKSSLVSIKLQKRQGVMEELQTVQSLLKKLQAVFDLPKKMRAALEEDILDTAVSFYAEAQPLLKKYGNCGTFRQIGTESDQVAKEISQVLKRRLTERKDSEEQCVLLLRKLGEPDDTLQDKYLQGRSQRLKRILREASLVVDLMAGAWATEGPLGKAPAPHHEALRQIESPSSWGFPQEGSAPPLRVFVKALDEKVINALQETVMNVLRFFLQDDDQAAAKRKPLVALAREVFADYFKIVRRALADTAAASVHKAARLKEASADVDFSLEGPHMDFLTDWGADAIAQGLSTLSADLSLLNSNLPELSLKESAADMVTSAVHNHLADCFGAVHERIMGAVVAARSRLDAQQQGAAQGPGAGPDSGMLLRRAYCHIVELVQKGLAALMQGLRSYENHPRLLSSWHDKFMDAVQGQLQQLFLSLLAAFIDITKIKYDGSDLLREALKASNTQASLQGHFSDVSSALASIWHPLAGTCQAGTASRSSAVAGKDPSKLGGDLPKSGLVLLLAKLCTYMEQQSVPWVMEALAGSVLVQHGGSGARSSDLPPAFVPGEVARRLNATSSALLAAYVELHGRQLSLMVRRSVAATNWLHHKEPRGARPVCDLMVQTVMRAEAEVMQLVEDTGRRTEDRKVSSAVTKAGYDAGLALETGNVERNLAKIFREKVKTFGTVQFTQANILAAIVGVGLKSLVECVRLQTLGRAGLQQLQLDCHYLRPQLRRFTGGQATQVVDSLLDEVVNAGVERSTDPSLLEPSVLERILSAADSSS